MHVLQRPVLPAPAARRGREGGRRAHGREAQVVVQDRHVQGGGCGP